ncbi:hypothetical protein BT69DRAFT_1229457 [Atractiella rhizophila]|nr:hypothetical protein BT69DRAFT_1229457 [Atractiella rhizophila]
MASQTSTPAELLPLPTKDVLLQAFKSKSLSSLRTPAIVIERKPYADNCQAMAERVKAVGARFRAHVKSHKTAEGTLLQLQTSPASHSVVCSTLPEAWGLVHAGLAKSGVVHDMLYGFPLPLDKIADLASLQEHYKEVLVMIDDIRQVNGLAAYNDREGKKVAFKAFVKVNQGNLRAGLELDSPELAALIKSIISSPYLSIYGFYTHSGDAYASRDPQKAQEFLTTEIRSVASASSFARKIYKEQQKEEELTSFVLSVGSTPTAHVSSSLSQFKDLLHSTDELEVHAGVYPLCDLQQQSTSLVPAENLAMGVLSRVCAIYEHRKPPQALIDAGAIAFSKDQGPTGDFGRVYFSKQGLEGWRVYKTSQEHGLLSPPEGMSDEEAKELLKNVSLGEIVKIRPQHACLTCAAHHWYYVTETKEEETVSDVWVPWKAW